MRARFAPAALEEYREALAHSQRRFGLGDKFIAGMEAALQEIQKAPERFQAVDQDFRMYRMRRFPYYLFYHYEAAEQTVTVYAVAHRRRNPDYWRSRLP